MLVLCLRTLELSETAAWRRTHQGCCNMTVESSASRWFRSSSTWQTRKFEIPLTIPDCRAYPHTEHTPHRRGYSVYDLLIIAAALQEDPFGKPAPSAAHPQHDHRQSVLNLPGVTCRCSAQRHRPKPVSEVLLLRNVCYALGQDRTKRLTADNLGTRHLGDVVHQCNKPGS